LRNGCTGSHRGMRILNDHEQLRQDPVLAVLCGKKDVEGLQRRREQDRGKPGAGKSTLNRRGGALQEDRDGRSRGRSTVGGSLYSVPAAPAPEVVLDLDVTDDPIHGNQEGRFFHAYYGDYWKIASKNSSWDCLPTVPPPPRCAPINCGCTSPR
jgi:Transposase DDE domain group 1